MPNNSKKVSETVALFMPDFGGGGGGEDDVESRRSAIANRAPC